MVTELKKEQFLHFKLLLVVTKVFTKLNDQDFFVIFSINHHDSF